MKYTTNRRINVRTIRNLCEGDGLTLRNGKIVEYKTGWQVGLMGIECKTPEEVSKILHSAGCPKSCGIWLENGIYYVDFSKRITTKKSAMALGEICNQISIYGWHPRKAGQLVYLK